MTKRKMMAGIGAAALICALGMTPVMAAAEATPQGEAAWRFGGEMGGPRQELTDEQRAEMEAAMAEREEKTEAFVATLSAEQKALYEAMTPARPGEGEGQPPAKPDEAAMATMEANREAFIASLTQEQKTAYDALFAGMGRGHAMT